MSQVRLHSEPTLLDLSLRALKPLKSPLTTAQARADALVSSFVDHATDGYALAGMVGGGLVYRLGRVGTMAIGSRLVGATHASPLHALVRLGAVGVGFTGEVFTFEAGQRALRVGIGGADPNLLNWSGENGLGRGLVGAAITLGPLKGAGVFAQGQNPVIQHLFQDSAMVLAHNVSDRIFTCRGDACVAPTIAEQFVNAEATLWQMNAGMALVHGALPTLGQMDRSLDLSIRSRVWASASDGPLRSLNEPLLATAGNTGPGRLPGLPENVMAMSAQDPTGRDGEGPPSASRLPAAATTLAPEKLERLPRGGVMVRTSKGLIQLGTPMWTNKDAFLRFLTQNGFGRPKEEVAHLVPTVFFFDPHYVSETDGLLPADFLQYMFFVTKGTRFHLVAPDEATQERLVRFLNLSFQGPRDESLTQQVRREYLFGAYGIPDLGREIAEGFPAPPPDVLRKVTHLNAEGEFSYQGVTVKKVAPLVYEITDQGDSLGRVDLREFPVPKPDFKRDREAAKDPRIPAVREKFLIEGRPGLLAIGTGHGFTPGEETSGFMLWNQGRAVLVDPPSSTLEFLYANGIPLETIEGIILTHGHTDHHGNAVPKLLRELPKVKIYATGTIYKMLQSQYELALGSQGEGLQQWNFVEMHPQQFISIIGLHLRPDYSFHSVPALGFEIYDRPDIKTGKLVTLFTGDTFADFSDVWRHTQPGSKGEPPLMTHERALNVMRHMALLSQTKAQNPPPVMLIEGGIAPIHIDPAKTRKMLDFAERHGVDTSRVRIYHIGEKPAADAGVEKWKAGPQGFMDLSAYYDFQPQVLEQYTLRLMDRLPLLNPLPPELKQGLLSRGSLQRYQAGETLIREGENDTAVYLMIDGEVEISRGGQLITVRPSGLVGEGALYGEPRNATVTTTVPSVFLKIDAETFKDLVKETDLLTTLRNIREIRREAYGAVVQSPLRRLPDSTLDVLFSFGTIENFETGQALIEQGAPSKDVYIVLSGSVGISNQEGTIQLSRGIGSMIGEMALVDNAPRKATVSAEGPVKVLKFSAEALQRLLDQYPGLRIALRRTAESRNGDRSRTSGH